MSKLSDKTLRHALDEWCRSVMTKDAATAAALRAEDYTLTIPDGTVLTREGELAMFGPSAPRATAVRLANVAQTNDTAAAVFDVEVESSGDTQRFRWETDFVKHGGQWQASRSRITNSHDSTQRRRRPSWIRRAVAKLKPAPIAPLPYLPYKPGEDFALPRTTPRASGEPLPVPPQSLWRSYNYSAHGAEHVQTMLDILCASDFRFAQGDRILDFGCAAGRMIRHLEPLAATCEIWGTDISSEHIDWCTQHLSPPFHFATTTTIPHLPFADRSFRFIYCGSVFTHIDDLAGAWLLELNRVLADDGRLFVTIHDNRTVELIEEASSKGADRHWLGWLNRRAVYREFKDSFDVMVIGRGHESQVFYDRGAFRRMAEQSYDVLSVTTEAYFYQTAVLLKPRKRGWR